MPWSWFEKRFRPPFPRRLRPGMTADEFRRMARNPSHLAPHPDELLRPGPFTPPGPPPLSAEERTLLDAVLADPDADGPRLRYAGWCDRYGDPRGEFIRLQVASPGTPREQELLAAHGDRWAAPLAPWSAEDVVFRRGFAEVVSLAGRAFISVSDGLFRTAPVRDVRLVAVAPYLPELARTPNLTHLARLDLRGNWVGPDGVRDLAGSPHLTRLRALGLSRNGLGGGGVRALLTAPWRRQLRRLELADNGLSLDDVRPLLDDGKLSALAALDLSGNPIDPAAAEILRERWGPGVLLR